MHYFLTYKNLLFFTSLAHRHPSLNLFNSLVDHFILTCLHYVWYIYLFNPRLFSMQEMEELLAQQPLTSSVQDDSLTYSLGALNGQPILTSMTNIHQPKSRE